MTAYLPIALLIVCAWLLAVWLAIDDEGDGRSWEERYPAEDASLPPPPSEG